MRRFLQAIAVATAVLCSASALAQTTGDIDGHVTDEQGGPLPGVTVEARSPSFQGVRTAVTDANGGYRLVLLPPGVYKVTATLEGFGRVERQAVVALGKTATGDFRLRPTASAEVVVTGEAPLIDESSSSVGTSIDSQQIKALPTGRNYTSIVQIAPGVSTQTSNTEAFANSITFYGSTGLENSFVIDGVVTNGVEYGAQGKELNYEFIQELEVKAGGYQAEYGRSTGGIINVITKSGGNEFHGEAFGYYTADGIQASNKYPDESLFGTLDGAERLDYGASLGGYVLKDRIWFFGAFDHVDNTTLQTLTSGPNAGQPANTDSTKNLGSAKATWMINPSNTVVGSYFQDPRDDSGAVNDGAHPLNGPYSTFIGDQILGGSDYSLRYNGLFGSDWVLAAQGAIHQEQNSVNPGLPGGDEIQYIDQRNNDLQSGGFGLIQEKSFKRYLAGISGTRYLSDHEIKGGFDYLEDNAEVIKRMSGGQRVTIIPNTENPSLPIYSHFYWTVPDASLPDNVPTSQLNANPYQRMFTFYLQDSWRVLSNLTVNLGLRYDNQQIFSGDGTRQINLTGSWAPRFGFSWDPTRDSRTKVFGSFGYFYEQIPMDLVIRSYSSERQPTIYNFDPTSIVPDATAATLAGDENAALQGGGKIFGGFNSLTDEGIKGQYLREGIFGIEREVGANIAVGARFIYRDIPRVIEDYLCSGEGDYCVGNPTRGRMASLFSLDYNTQFPAPLAKRIYKGFQLDATKRFSDNWTMMASYVYSTLQGNYDGLFAPYTQPRGTADPNISALYDYYDFFTKGPVVDGVAQPFTANGDLSNDRRNIVKLSGLYVTPFNLSVGLVTYFQTGTPVSRIGYSVAYDRYEFFLARRGSEGRVESSYDADLHLGYPLQLGPVTVTMLADIFNLLNTQRVVIVDQRYNISEFSNPDYICGSQPGSADEAACNSFYGQPLARTLPLSVRFGLKVGF